MFQWFWSIYLSKNFWKEHFFFFSKVILIRTFTEESEKFLKNECWKYLKRFLKKISVICTVKNFLEICFFFWKILSTHYFLPKFMDFLMIHIKSKIMKFFFEKSKMNWCLFRFLRQIFFQWFSNFVWWKFQNLFSIFNLF